MIQHRVLNVVDMGNRGVLGGFWNGSYHEPFVFGVWYSLFMEGFLGKLFFGGDKEKKDSEREQGQSGDGRHRPGVFESVTGSGPYMEARKKERGRLVDEFRKEERSMREGWRKEEKDLEKSLAKEKAELERHYRVDDFKADDPRRAQAEKMVAEKFERERRHVYRDFEERKKQALAQMKKQREAQWKDVQEELRGKF